MHNRIDCVMYGTLRLRMVLAAVTTLFVIAGGNTLAQTLTLSTEYVHSGSRLLAVVHKPSGYFTDVPANLTDEANVLHWTGISAGCAQYSFCPNNPMTRGEMAVFIIGSIYVSLLGPGQASSFSYTPTPYFTDVPVSHPYFKWIQKMRDLGITSGCSPTTYCPDDNTLNYQMAVFTMLARQYVMTNLTGSAFAYTTTPYFTDVYTTDGYFKFVQAMVDLNVVSATGCSLPPCQFSPVAPLTRGQGIAYAVRGILNDYSY